MGVLAAMVHEQVVTRNDYEVMSQTSVLYNPLYEKQRATQQIEEPFVDEQLRTMLQKFEAKRQEHYDQSDRLEAFFADSDRAKGR